MLKSVAVILEDFKGQFILQKRENRPGIGSPGKVAIFGGQLEQGETPIAAALRELMEELELKLNEASLAFWGRYRFPSSLTGELMERFVFVAKNIDPSGLVLHEGEAIVYADASVLERDDLSAFSRKVLHEYQTRNSSA